jgi:uncharacterized protein
MLGIVGTLLEVGQKGKILWKARKTSQPALELAKFLGKQLSKRNTSNRSLIVITKVISACNFACRYCDADIYSNQRISIDTVSNIIKKALDYADYVEFVWHGGEPLLMGVHFYKEVVELQKKFKHENQVIMNSIATNGTLISQEWVDFFKANDFHVGVSLDGPPEVHNANRVFRNGQGSFEQVMRGIRLLKENGVKFGVLAVITKETVRLGAKRFLDFFIKNGIFNIGILPQRPALNIGRTDALPRYEFEKFAIELFDYWYSLDDPRIEIRELNAVLDRIFGAESKSAFSVEIAGARSWQSRQTAMSILVMSSCSMRDISWGM